MSIWMQKITHKVLSVLDPRVYNILNYHYLHIKNGVVPKCLNIKSPKTFNEKIIWLKLHHRFQEAHIIADKVAVKQYIAEKLGSKYLIPTLGVYKKVPELDYDKLPNSFVLKLNHGSGWNVFCKDKSKINIVKTNKLLNRWLHTNYSKVGKEYQYQAIIPKILCESYLENSKDVPLIDYKIFCFSGVPKLIQVDIDRYGSHRRNFYNERWEMMPFTTLYPNGVEKIEKPALLKEMFSISAELSTGHPFARIDLYYYQERIYFGEFTFHHGGGFEPFIPQKYDRILGDMISLPGNIG